MEDGTIAFTETFQSEGVEFDATYQRSIADIEEQTVGSGWLFGRGAFDKADEQYLRDFNRTIRKQETQMDELAREMWERERLKLERDAITAANAAAMQRAASLGEAAAAAAAGAGALGGSGQPGPAAGLPGPAAVAGNRPEPLLLQVRVTSKHERRSTSPEAEAVPNGGDGTEPACKRPRTAAGGAAGEVGPGPSSAAHAAAPKAARPSRGATIAPNAAAGFPTYGGQAAAAAVAVAAAAGKAAAAAAAAGGGGGGAFFGGYGSASESDGSDDEDDQPRCHQHGRKGASAAGAAHGRGGRAGAGTAPKPKPAGLPALPLMSADALFSDNSYMAGGVLATLLAPQAVGGADGWQCEEQDSEDERQEEARARAEREAREAQEREKRKRAKAREKYGFAGFDVSSSEDEDEDEEEGD